jgi:hypothetical protein
MLENIIYALIGVFGGAAVADYFSSKIKKQLKTKVQIYKKANDYLNTQLDNAEKTIEALKIMDKAHIEQIELKDKEIEFFKAIPLVPKNKKNHGKIL